MDLSLLTIPVLSLLRPAAAQGSRTANSTINATLSPVPTVNSLTPVTAPVPKRSCYTNLTEIENLVTLKNPFVEETYVLCPNTIFPIGGLDSESVWIGYMPINVRANSVIQCGVDGKSSNNCTIQGGPVQLLNSLEKFSGENRVGVFLKGLTFEGAVDANVVLAAPGNITFIDCIFQVSLESRCQSKPSRRVAFLSPLLSIFERTIRIGVLFFCIILKKIFVVQLKIMYFQMLNIKYIRILIIIQATLVPLYRIQKMILRLIQSINDMFKPLEIIFLVK